MRAYFFGNFYLSSIQQGIQALHCVSDMFVQYGHESNHERTLLYDWAANHKVVVLLNGGNAESLRETYLSFRNLCGELRYPYGTFSEDAESLDSARTCVGVIVPEGIYKYNEIEREQRQSRSMNPSPLGNIFVSNPWQLNATEKALAGIIDAAPLAR